MVEKKDAENTEENQEAIPVDDPGSWLIETYDPNEGEGWTPSNLNAITDIEWIRKAKVQNDPKTLIRTHSFDWCVEIIKKAAKYHRDFNAVEYRLVDTEKNTDDVLPCSIFM